MHRQIHCMQRAAYSKARQDTCYHVENNSASKRHRFLGIHGEHSLIVMHLEVTSRPKGIVRRASKEEIKIGHCVNRCDHYQQKSLKINDMLTLIEH